MALTTTWTEQSVVDFTAGTISTITDCVTEVQSKLTAFLKSKRRSNVALCLPALLHRLLMCNDGLYVRRKNLQR